MRDTSTSSADVSVRAAVEAACPGWELREDTLWLRVGMDRLDPLWRSGWKLHLSSLPDEFPLFLKTVLPKLTDAQAPFKIICGAERLEELNDGRFGLAQVGKAVTVYPASEEAANAIAAVLAKALRDFGGPQVPTDFRYAEDAPVYFRYGPFDGRFRIDGMGRKRRLLWHPEHGDVIDPADGGDTPPPRQAHLPERVAYDHLDFLRDHFLLLKMLHLSAKGGVFIALDPESPSVGRLIVKTARRGTHGDEYGRDAVWALKREHALLSRFEEVPGLPVAGTLENDGDAVSALIRPYYSGETFFERWTAPGSAAPSAKNELRRVLAALGEHARAWHDAGLVMRDLSPANILISGSEVRLLDVELAHDLDSEEPPFRRGTDGFYDPAKPRDANPAIQDDDYALDALQFMLETGAMPNWYRDGFHALQGEGGEPDSPTLSLPPAPITESAKTILASVESDLIRLEDAPADATALNVYDGLAGGLLTVLEHDAALAESLLPPRRLWKLTERFTEAATQVAHLSGLYFGGSGIGLALVAAGRFRRERGVEDAGDRILDALRHAPNDTPDITHGLAGYIAATLAAHRVTGEVRYLNWAVATGNRLQKLGVVAERGLLWPWPEGQFGTLSGAQLYGFAHGAAGVSWALLQLHAATDEQGFLDAALGGLDAIRGSVRSMPGVDHAVCWPCSATDDAIWNAWCHGAPGIVKALAAGLHARDHETDRALIARAVQGIAATNNGHYCLCHGVASRLDAYCAALPWLEGDVKDRIEAVAAKDAQTLAAMDVFHDDGDDTAPLDASGRGLMTGGVGVARTLLQFEFRGQVEGPYGQLLP